MNKHSPRHVKTERFWEQTLNLTLTKLTKEDHKELKLLAYGRPHVAVEDYNGNVFVMGLQHGAEVSGGTISSGAGMGDLSGYTLTLSAQELKPANFLASPTAADPYAGMSSATVTVTQGTIRKRIFSFGKIGMLRCLFLLVIMHA